MDQTNNFEISASTLAAMIAIVTGVGFSISILYDLGYYAELGYPFSELPTTFSDHVRSCINWAPLAIMVVLGIVFPKLIIVRLERGLTESEIINSSSNPRRTQIIRHFPYIIVIPALSIIGIFLYFMFGDRFRFGLPMFYFFVWLLFSGLVQYHPRIIARRSKCIIYLFMFGPAVCLLVYYTAKNIAYTDLRDKSNLTTITLSPGTTLKTRILRSLDRGFIVHDPDTNEIKFIALSTVSSLVRQVNISTNNGYFKDKESVNANTIKK